MSSNSGKDKKYVSDLGTHIENPFPSFVSGPSEIGAVHSDNFTADLLSPPTKNQGLKKQLG